MSYFDEFATGAGTGALSAGVASGGNPYAIVGGAIIGGTISVLSSKKADDIEEERARELEQNRINAVMREFGAQQQAIQTAAAVSQPSKNTRKIRPNNISRDQGEVGPNSEALSDTGLIGKSLNESGGDSAGTF